MPITLSAEENETLKVGLEFKKLQASPAYQKLIVWIDEYVEAARLERDEVLSARSGLDHVSKATLVWYERFSLHEKLTRRVEGIIEQAKQLSEAIAKEQEEANV